MRVLLITNRYPMDADDTASPFVPHFARALTTCGVSVDVLTPRYAPPGRRFQDDRIQNTIEYDSGAIRVSRFESGSANPIGSWNYLNPKSWLRLARFMREGRKAGEALCRDNRYDHILALWALPSGQFARTLSQKFKVPYSVWCLGSDIYTWAHRPLIRGQIAKILRGAKQVFGDGDDLCGKIYTWLGIEAAFLPSFRPLPDLQDCAAPGPTNRPKYLCLGRLHPAKGVFDLLAAFTRVRDVIPGASLRFVGSGPGAVALRQHAGILQLENDVSIDGALPQDGVIAALRDCDCVVIPSKSDSIPLVFTEAMQAMRPVIGTDVGDLGNYIRKYNVGMVTQSLETSDLALTMIAMAREPIFDRSMRDKLLEEFEPNRAARAFCESVFEGIPSERPKKKPAQVKGPARVQKPNKTPSNP